MTSTPDDFDAFVRARTPALLRTAHLLTGDQHRAEDLVQDALIRTHRAWPRVRDGHPDAYTRKVMYHLNIARWRRTHWIEVNADVLADRSSGPDRAEQVVSRLDLKAALGELTAKQRAVVVLRFLEDASEAEAAELLGVSVGTVKSQTAKALARLRSVAPSLLEATEEVKQVDMGERVREGSRRITVRNRLIGAGAAVIVLVGGLVGFTLLQRTDRGPGPGPGPLSSHSPSPSPAPSASPAPSPLVPRQDPAAAALGSSTLVLPAFPGGPAGCSGSRTFVNGQVMTREPSGSDSTLKLGTIAVRTDLDGTAGEELIVELTCYQETSYRDQLLVVKPAAGNQPAAVLGFVLPAGVIYDRNEGFHVLGRQVVVPVAGGCSGDPCQYSAMDRQQRTYTWQSGRFTQTAGPTAFPALVADVRQVDLRNSTMLVTLPENGTAWSGYLRFEQGAGQGVLRGPGSPERNTAPFRATIKQIVYVPTNDWDSYGAAAVLVTMTGPDGKALDRLLSVHRQIEGWPAPTFATLILSSGGELASIDTIEGGPTPRVTVTKAGGGREVRKYTLDGGATWNPQP